MAWSAAALGLLVALAAVGFALSRSAALPAPARFHVVLPDAGATTGIALSPDGRRLAFVSRSTTQRVSIRAIDSLESRELTDTEGAEHPFWSPDGRFIGFFAQGKLRRIPASGGAAQALCAASSGAGGSWSQSGIILFAPGSDDGLYQVPADGGTPAPVTTRREGQAGHRFPQFLPDGRRFLFLVRSGQQAKGGVYVGLLDSKETSLVLETDTSARYAPPGHLLFIRGNSLMAQSFDLGTTRLSGEMTPIADDVWHDTGGGLSDFAATGNLVAYRQGEHNRRELVWIDRAGKRLGDAGTQGDYIHPWISPDEKRAVAEVVDPETGTHAVWMVDLVRGSRSRFVEGPAASHWPVWSADGRRILFSSDRNGPWSLFARATSGVGGDEALLTLPTTVNATDWSRDGRFIVYQTNAASTRSDLWAVPVTPPGKPFPIANSAAAERQAQLSPDGRWVAFVADDPGRDEVFVQGFPDATGKSTVSVGGGTQPQWRRDGREMFYLSTDLKLMAVAVSATGSSIDTGTPQPLFDLTDLRTDLSARNNFMPSEDGKRFLVNRPLTGRASHSIAVVVDWTGLVRSR